MDSLAAYIATACQSPLLDRDQERDLAVRIRAGDENARRLFIEANLRLVVYWATRLSFPGAGATMDLIGEGNLALVHAVDRYDPAREIPFVCYAGRCIRGRMKYALTKMHRENDPLVSLSEPIGDDDTVEATIAADVEHPQREIDLPETRSIVRKLLATLTDKEREIVRSRFGFNGKKQTLRFVAQRVGISHAGVENVCARAIRKLRKRAKVLAIMESTKG